MWDGKELGKERQGKARKGKERQEKGKNAMVQYTDSMENTFP